LREIIIAAVALGALVGISSLVSYSSANERVIRSAISLIVLFTVASPVVSAAGRLVDLYESGAFEVGDVEITGGAYDEVSERAFCEGVAKYVWQVSGIDREQVRVLVYGYDAQEVKCENIKIILGEGGALVDHRRLRERVLSEIMNGKGECTVEISVY
jgi:hypothetical protein